jgi:hypothetical protein
MISNTGMSPATDFTSAPETVKHADAAMTQRIECRRAAAMLRACGARTDVPIPGAYCKGRTDDIAGKAELLRSRDQAPASTIKQR